MAVATSYTGRPQNAFCEITQLAPSSTTQEKEPFDVFINHRGPDVKRRLASCIYRWLRQLGVKVFLDRDEVELGDLFPKKIEDVMRSARIHIAIFSKDYATSPWCLEELSIMLEIEATIIPVFYNVEPVDLRWGTRGCYAKAFCKHETDGRYQTKTLEKWKRALRTVSFIAGYEFNNDSDEGILLEKIVNRVQKAIRDVKVPFEVARYPVGLDNVVREFETVRSARGYRDIEIVGIVGIGGSGKTTLAKELYNRKCLAYNNCSFLSEVRESELLVLQKQLLRDVIHLPDMPFKDASQGKSILAGRLRSFPVLIVLDDVDHVDQLDSLLPENGTSLGSGSLIIITTRDLGVLRSWGISHIYKMRTLDPCHAKELFCLHAFRKQSPPEAFEDLVEEFLNACNGLALSLQVIAGMLHRKTKEQWKSNLTKISRLLPDKIKQRLKLSYDGLDKEEQDIFLDVACFFDGEKKNLAIAVWDAAEWSGLDNLVNKCLVEVDKQNRIRMHSLLRNLGRELASECRPHRLWSTKQINKIMSYRKEIRGIMAATTKFIGTTKSFATPADEFTICCDPYPDTKLPSWVSLKNLRVLELYGASRLQQWEDSAHPPEELREMIITATEGDNFHSFPSKVSGLKHLRKISLISYKGKEFRFKRLPDGFCDLQSLEYLELRHCIKLSVLPTCFGKLKALRHLDLCGCRKLGRLPDSFMELVKLKYMNLSGGEGLLLMPEILANIRKLKNLYLSGHSKLQILPAPIAEQKSLRELHLKNTMLLHVPKNINQLSKLETLLIGSPHLRRFPKSLGNLSSLTRLKITGCRKLETLPSSLKLLKSLEYLFIKSSGVRYLPEGFRELTNLQILKIFYCPVAQLDLGSGSSSSLGKLNVIHLKAIHVTSLTISEDCCPNLETLQLELNDSLKEIDVLSKSVKKLCVRECPMLSNINTCPGLLNLETFEVTGCAELAQDPVTSATGSTVSTKSRGRFTYLKKRKG